MTCPSTRLFTFTVVTGVTAPSPARKIPMSPSLASAATTGTARNVAVCFSASGPGPARAVRKARPMTAPPMAPASQYQRVSGARDRACLGASDGSTFGGCVMVARMPDRAPLPGVSVGTMRRNRAHLAEGPSAAVEAQSYRALPIQVLRAHEGRIDEVLRQEPHVHLVRPNDLADHQVVGAVVARLLGHLGRRVSLAQDELVRLEQTRELHRNFLAPARRPFDFGHFGHVVGH